MLIVLDDLTEQERRELAEREFVSNAAHELRTPLTTIIGAVEVLQAGAKEDPVERDRFLAHIEREAGAARAARARAADARARARRDRSGRASRRSPLARAPARGRGGPAAARRRRGRRRVPTASPSRSNRDLLEQVLRNLGENAAKHTARRVDRAARVRATGTSVHVEVEDTGPGMSAETQRHVFDRFYRGERDAEGFGLGLAIVRESVRSLDGRIELDSSPGEGTVFRIVLEPARVREEVPAGVNERIASVLSSTTMRASSTSSRSRCGARASRSTRSATGRPRSRRPRRRSTTSSSST